MGGHGSLTAALLLLIWHTTAGAAFNITSNFTGNVLAGNNFSLSISYPNTLINVLVLWLQNGTNVARWNQKPVSVEVYRNNLELLENGTKLWVLNSAKNDSGKYNVRVVPSNTETQSMDFQVNVYEPVKNVTVTPMPETVDEKTAAVNLTCHSDGDVMTVVWTRGGETLGSIDPYSLLDGNSTLQIKYPNRTHTGNYTCDASNPVSRASGWRQLNVSYTESQAAAALSGGAIAGIVIGSVLGAILLIALLIILIFCIRKRRNGNEKKLGGPQRKDVLRTVSGNTLSPDDPAYFTVNNIMYRNSSISMGSYIMNSVDSVSGHNSPTANPPSSPPKVKHATQV